MCCTQHVYIAEGFTEMVMNTKGICAYLGISRSLLYRLKREEGLPSFKAGGSVKYFKESIDEWIRSRQVSVSTKKDH